jgi:phosphatidylglycerophosphate synthase
MSPFTLPPASTTPAAVQPDAASATEQPARMTVGPVRTVPNLITSIRTAGAIAVAGVAIATATPWLLAVAYAVYWLGDMLDGWAARRLHQETRLGAVFDIVSDRACTSILCAGLIAWRPGIAVEAVLFFASFMVADALLSLAFLCWPIMTPNHFGRVDDIVYRLNWSPPAKALNTAGVVLLALAGQLWPALALTAVVLAVKLWSGARVLRLLAAEGR